MKSSTTLFGVTMILTATILGPFFTESGYSSITNAISELGVQGSPNAWIMNAGFVVYGVGVLIDAIRRLRAAPAVAIVFIVFGLAMVMNAVFSHQPINQAVPYNAREDELHSLFATMVGIAFTFGTIAQSFLEHSRWRRYACFGAAASAVILPLLMLQFPGVQGVFQRLLFGISFAWLVIFLPGEQVEKIKA